MDFVQLQTAFQGHTLPVAFVLLEAFEHNARHMAQAAAGKTLRLATKSVRCRALLQYAANQAPTVYRGWMTYHAAETLHLAQQGFHDLLLAYPVSRAPEADCLVQAAALVPNVRAMVDLPAHADVLQAAATRAGIRLQVCLDVDASLPLPGLWFGVWRSSVRTPEQALQLAEYIRKSCPNLVLDGVMSYEAQIAGLPDRIPSRGWKMATIRWLKRRSIRELGHRRAAVVLALRQAGFDIRLVNGGGTGSLPSTSQEEVVTEVTVGSGLYQSHLFDHHTTTQGLQPSAGYAIAVTRHPKANRFTAAGGGYTASGAAGPDCLPVIWWPEGAQWVKNEGVGEVQSPFTYTGPQPMEVGSWLVLRHAKAGELMERFPEVYLLRNGCIESCVPTYRG